MNIIKFMLRLCHNMFILFVVSIPLQLIGALLLAIVIPINGLKPLPRLLKWFDNADQYLGRDTSTYFAIRDSGIWNMYCWLAWRNPCNYFGYNVLGLPPITSIQDVQTIGDPEVGDGTKSGLYHVEATIDGHNRYEYYYIHKWDATHCFRFRMGYKLGSPVDRNLGRAVEAVMVISPWHSYTGV